MWSFRSVVLISWFVFVTVTASAQQQAHAQPAPAPPIVPPTTDQVIDGFVLGDRESAAVGFQDRLNRFFVVLSDQSTGRFNAALIGTDGSTIGMPQVISATPGSCPVVTKRVAGLETSHPFPDPPIVAWLKGQSIVVRIVNPDGSPSGPEVVVDTSINPEFRLGCPSLSRPILFGKYLMTWNNLGTLRGQILDTSNALSPLVGAPFNITTGTALSSAVEFEQNTGHFLVVYKGPQGVFGQLVTADGMLVGAAFEIAAAAGVNPIPVVAYSPEATEGRFLVVWDERKPIAPTPPFPGFPSFRSRIVGQRVHLAGSGLDATLSLTGGLIEIDEPTTLSIRDFKGPPDIVYSLALGQYLVVWHNPSTHQVTGRLINFDGTMPREPFPISVSPITSLHGSNPRVAWSETVPPVSVSPSGEFIPNRMEYIALWRGNLGDVRFRFVDPHLDSDGDALLDNWETGGADLNNDGQINTINDINLVTLEPNNLPNPRRKDVYLELDWMDCALGGCAAGDQHNHRLRDLDGNTVPEIVEQMISAFARSNVWNPDGSNGITLHVDYGQLGGGNAIADDQVKAFPSDVKAVNLDRLRRRIFRYGLAIHLGPGAAEHIPGTFFWAGRGGDEKDLLSAIQIAANTFMHELGHTLGLDHGGFDSINFKPNYLSVMNYAFVGGIPVIGGQTPLLDFSRQILLPLKESDLNEQAGIGLASGNLGTIFSCPSGVRSQQPAAGAIDWNCNSQIDRHNVTVDLNGGGLSVLQTSQFSDNWNNLFYNLRMSGSFSSAAFVPTSDNPIPPLEDIPSPEEIHQSLAPPILEIGIESLPPVVKPGDQVRFVVKVENTGLGLAQNVGLMTKVDEQHVGMFSLGALPPGDSAMRRGSFVVPEECVPTLTFFATVDLEDALNEPLPSVMHSQEVQVICDDDEK